MDHWTNLPFSTYHKDLQGKFLSLSLSILPSLVFFEGRSTTTTTILCNEKASVVYITSNFLDCLLVESGIVLWWWWWWWWVPCKIGCGFTLPFSTSSPSLLTHCFTWYIAGSQLSFSVSFISAQLASLRATPLVLSMCDPATNNWMKKSQNMPVWLSKMVLVQHFCAVFAEAGNRHSKA
jgi:hypothetical protein